MAVEKLEVVAEDMIETVKVAKKILENDRCRGVAFEEAYESMLLDMNDPKIRIIDEYAPQRYGFEIPERLFWQVCVDANNRGGACLVCTNPASGLHSPPGYHSQTWTRILSWETVSACFSGPESIYVT